MSAASKAPGRSFFPAARWAASSARTTPSAQDILARRSASSGWHGFFWSYSSRAPTTSTWSLPDILFHRSSTLWTHFWEEPCVSGEQGSGTVFFSGCPLGCVFCQNHTISAGHFGKEVSIERLAQIFLELQQQGANNINLVTAGHFVPQVIDALDRVRHQLHIPVVYNSSGYETVQTLRMLAGYIDVYLPDLKFYSPERSARYCSAPDYFAVASAAVQEMFAQTGPVQLDSRGIIQKGTIVRHMVMPDGVEDSMDILSWIAEHLPLDDILVSVMSQYTPFYKSADYPEINRRLLPQEYERVLDWMECMGIENGFIQELSSAKEEYTPDFSLQGRSFPPLKRNIPLIFPCKGFKFSRKKGRRLCCCTVAFLLYTVNLF